MNLNLRFFSSNVGLWLCEGDCFFIDMNIVWTDGLFHGFSPHPSSSYHT